MVKRSKFMKKIVVGLLGLAAVIAGAFFLRTRETPHQPGAAEFAPPEAIVFAHLPDVQRSLRRWRETALFHIWSEPQVQAFLEKPRRKAPLLAGLSERLARLDRAGLREAFAAVTSLDGALPKWVAGFSFSGSRADLEALLAEPRAALRSAWPAGRSAVVRHGAGEIETFTQGGATVAQAFRGGWYFVATDLALLEATLDRRASKAAAGLAGDDIFKRATAPLPPEGDELLFVLPGALTGKLGELLAAAGRQPAAHRALAIAASTKFEGVQIRDTLFVLAPGSKQPPLPGATLALTTADTLLYYAMTLPEQIAPPEALAPLLSPFAPGLAAMGKDLGNVQWPDFIRAFGPEAALLAAWPAEEETPAVLLTLDVRDAARAKEFIDTLTGAEWVREERGGATFYQAPAGAIPLFAPTIALTGKFLVLGLSGSAVEAGLARIESGASHLDQSAEYRALAAQVGEPTAGFGYLDLRPLFEQAYGMTRPFLAMSLAFSGDAGNFIDASKLPATDAIAKHLAPSVYAQRATESGTLTESVGAITFQQAVLGLLAAAGASAGSMDALTKASGLFHQGQQLRLPGTTPAPAPR